jgi:ubiquinone/menaquinone biosynthesis C-methylase UbiE
VIADIGAGTGALLGPIGSAAPAARVVALDASTRMLRIARTRRGASAVLADALALPLADGTADAVILAYVLFHLADPARAAAEAARVLRPGGRLASSPGRGNGSRVPAPCGIRSLPKPACRPPRCAASIPG